MNGIGTTALIVLGYGWMLYPLLLCLVSRKREGASVAGGADVRSVDVLLAAHNEEGVLGARLENLKTALDSWAGMARAKGGAATWKVHVGLDGCTDGTEPVVALFCRKNEGFECRTFAERRGKVAVLKDLVEGARGDVLVFTDANSAFEAEAVARLLAPFVDVKVGGVCGRLVLARKGVAGAAVPPLRQAASQRCGEGGAEGLYWRMENWLKERESDVDSCLGANGGIYAVRRDLFWKGIPANTVVDDFVIGMKVREAGHRVLYEPAAVAREDLPDTRDEWKRRVRIGAGDFQALGLCRSCLLPQYGWFAWMFWSHKVIRWFTPHLLLVWLWASVVARWLAVAGLLLVLLYRVRERAGASSGGSLGRLLDDVARGVRGLEHFVVMQVALLAGFLRYCRGGLSGAWERTGR